MISHHICSTTGILNTSYVILYLHFNAVARRRNRRKTRINKNAICLSTMIQKRISRKIYLVFVLKTKLMNFNVLLHLNYKIAVISTSLQWVLHSIVQSKMFIALETLNIHRFFFFIKRFLSSNEEIGIFSIKTQLQEMIFTNSFKPQIQTVLNNAQNTDMLLFMKTWIQIKMPSKE